MKNIRNFADLLQGAIIEPGESLSLNEYVGRRTTEKGFVPAGTIVNGHLVDSVGGGISQFATTIFNASFFAGLEFDRYQSHSIYFSRYPYGREATISWPAPELQIHNPSPYGVLIWPTSTENSVTVDIYSTQWAIGEQTGQTSRPIGEACTRVTTERTRTFVEDGQHRSRFGDRHVPSRGDRMRRLRNRRSECRTGREARERSKIPTSRTAIHRPEMASHPRINPSPNQHQTRIQNPTQSRPDPDPDTRPRDPDPEPEPDPDQSPIPTHRPRADGVRGYGDHRRGPGGFGRSGAPRPKRTLGRPDRQGDVSSGQVLRRWIDHTRTTPPRRNGLRPKRCRILDPGRRRNNSLAQGRRIDVPLPDSGGVYAAIARRTDLDAALVDFAIDAGAHGHFGRAVTGLDVPTTVSS